MRIVILPTPSHVAEYAADRVLDVVNGYKNPVLGLATGSTPVELYKVLVTRYQAELVSFEHVKSFNLDEYIGIDGRHQQSYRYFMNAHLFDHIDINMANTHVPLADGLDAKELALSAQLYENNIKVAGGIDLQILGVGINGHIGFNEPTSSFASRTRIKTLSQSTVEANQRFFEADEFQPKLAMTMGIATILESRSILLMATGEQKAKAVKHMIEGPISSMWPGSILQQHAATTVVLDEAAASELALKDYYLWCEKERQSLQQGSFI
ncbi:glucosamine-6-phosphate deaminase [Reinekea thalattae]|uniref:Glucosamine-6-phosphate deaminase n=1 Tax=Reinekea thalattae TaxID=2593301 RepID=A0A5C8Z4B5_9GAMM|nr:glucosamine-6-phosphate deaminase [Reinekea thalattae]TXR52038.1 glucosamine-6-phosphate deaminase [Reinekea thalattae]